jgi:hypothetical protein
MGDKTERLPVALSPNRDSPISYHDFDFVFNFRCHESVRYRRYKMNTLTIPSKGFDPNTLFSSDESWADLCIRELICHSSGGITIPTVFPRSRATNQLILCETLIMSDVEDYPGPTHNHPEKKGQDPPGRADEGMVKPSVSPEPKKEKPRKQKQKRR